MKAVWAILFLLLPTLAGVAQQPLPAWNSDNEKAWWGKNPTPATWTQAATDLHAQLDGDYRKNGASVFSDSDFQGWERHLQWIQLGLGAPDLLVRPENLSTFVALGQDDQVSHLLVEKMVPQDVPAAALRLLIRLAQANLADLHEYAALGVAFCLVFDAPFPTDWPHSQVAPSAVPIGDLDVVTRFNFYVASNRNKKTDTDLTQLRFEDLIHVVDSEVKLSELAYAQTRTYPYSHFADAYFGIKYALWRIKPGEEVYDWPYLTYALMDIEDKAGICIDQSYYASLVGKGRGIPTMMFTGEGTDAAHAWFGYLDRSDKWEMDCGRYESGGFVKGVERDPQTWTEVKDTTIDQFAANGVNNPNYPAAEAGLAWARWHGTDPSAHAIYDDTRTLMPELVATWQAESDYLDKTQAPADDRKMFYQAWISQFSASADLKVEGQTKLFAVLQKANDPDAQNLGQDIILQNRSSGSDLGVQGSSQTINDKLKARDWDGAQSEFEKAVRDFSDQGGVAFFRGVIWPYVETCLYHGQISRADDGLRFAADRISVDPTSQMGENLAQLKDQVAEEKEGEAAAESWLGELDSGKADQAWSEAGPIFQSNVTSDKWTTDTNAARQQAGDLTSRTLTALGFKPGGEKGNLKIPTDFIEAQFTTGFSSRPAATELVVFAKAGDHHWQAVLYQLK